MIAGLTTDGLIAPWVIPGAMDRDGFDTWVETQLLPAIPPGTVVILDNRSVHRSPRASSFLKAHRSWFVPLPPYSPNLNPIEMAFAKLKAHPRNIGARTFDALLSAIGTVYNLITPDECLNSIEHAGYAAD